MNEELLQNRSNVCELCQSSDGLSGIEVNPSDGSVDQSILVCVTCKSQVSGEIDMDENHWNCLHESMWSEVPAVQVMAYRLLSRLGWQDQLEMLYLEDEVRSWAEAGLQEENKTPTKDSNGTVLQAGDSVSIIKDLEVKGAGFTAKRGTTVRNISLTDNPEQIEGRVNGVKIVLLSKFLKKV